MKPAKTTTSLEEEKVSKNEPTPAEEKTFAQKYDDILKNCKKFIKLDPALIKKAAAALKSYISTKKDTSSKKELLEDEDNFIYVTITLSKVPTKFSPKPVQISLPHAIYGEKYLTHICLFVKDPQRKFKDLVQDLEVPCLAKIIGYEKLMKNYKQYETRRKLVNEFDLFFCDKRIYRMLPKVTGSFFYRKKKFPCPLEIKGDGENIKELIEEGLKSTYLMLGNGPHYSFRMARTSMENNEIVENIMEAIYKGLPNILRDELKPSKVQSITLKTGSSPELPIYCHLGKKDAKAFLGKEKEGEKMKDE